MPVHSSLQNAKVHEPKHITDATAGDAGKVITPSSSTNGKSVLRKLASNEITYDPSSSLLSSTDIKAALDELSGDSSKVEYDNTDSGLTAENVKDALDEIDGKFGDASNVEYDNTASGLSSTNVKDALDELNSDDEAVDTSYDNSSSGLTATDVQAAIDEVLALYEPAYGSHTVTNNSTAISLTAAGDSTFLTAGDYTQITGIFDSPAIGPTNNVTINTNDIEVEVDGVYSIGFWGTFQSDTNSVISAVNFGINGTAEVDRHITTRLPNNTDPISNSAEGVVSLSAGDLVTFWIVADTTANVTINNGRFYLTLLERT